MNHLVPRVVRHPKQQIVTGDSSVVDQNVKAAVAFGGIGHRFGQSFTVTNVAGARFSASTLIGDFFGQRFKAIGRASNQDHVTAIGCQFLSNGSANTPACAGHKCNTSIHDVKLHSIFIRTLYRFGAKRLFDQGTIGGLRRRPMGRRLLAGPPPPRLGLLELE